MLTKMGTWKLVIRPEGRKIVDGKWVFKVKRNPDGSIKKYKARFVARGFSQMFGVDYLDTFAPVARHSTLRTLLAVATKHGWKLEQSDVTNAYLNASLSEDNDEIEEIFVRQPEGKEQQGENGEELVCRLEKGLYGLKQAARLWYKRLTRWLLAFGFLQSQADPCLFILKRGGGRLILVIYVDDLAFTGDRALMEEFKQQIAKEFTMVHEGELTWLLGMNLRRGQCGEVILTQELYTDIVLERMRHQQCKGISTPAEMSRLSSSMSPTTQNEIEEMKQFPMRQLIGSLAYLAICTRPDIMNAVNNVSRFMENPGKQHWAAALRILRPQRNKGQRDCFQGKQGRRLHFTWFL